MDLRAQMIPNPEARVEKLEAPQVPVQEIAPAERATVSCVVCGAGSALSAIGPTEGVWWKCPNGHTWKARAL